MKILLVTPAFVPSKFGGIKTFSYNLSISLARQDNEVTVFTTDADLGYSRLKGIPKEQVIDGIKVRYFKNLSNVLAWKYHLFLPLELSVALIKGIGNFDIIHLQEYRGFVNIIICHYARKKGIPYVIHAHGDLPADFGKKHLKKIFDYLWGYSILKGAAKTIATTPFEYKQYIDMGVSEKQIALIPLGFNFSEFSAPHDKGAFRKKYGIGLDQKIILFLGRIHEIKGIDILIESFFEVSKDVPNCLLVIVGPDDGYLSVLMARIKTLNIQNKVIFTGRVDDKYEAYYDSDIYVLPSRYESFSNTVLEAWACGTPVILTDTCALSSLAQQAAIVVKYDSHELAMAIKKYLFDDELRRKNCDKGKALVTEKLNLEIVTRMIEICYQSVLENPR